MHVSLVKEYKINMNREKVWNFLTSEITSCIPDIEKLETLEDGFKLVIKPRFAFIKGKFRIESRIIEKRELEYLKIVIRGSSIGSSFDALIDLTLDNDTKIILKIEIDTHGLLKPLSSSLIYEVVNEISSSIISCMSNML